MKRYNQEELERYPDVPMFQCSTEIGQPDILLCRECYSKWLDNHDGESPSSGEPIPTEYLQPGDICDECRRQIGT